MTADALPGLSVGTAFARGLPMTFVTTPAAPMRRKVRAFRVCGWSMRPLPGLLLLKVGVATPTAGEPDASRSMLLALNEAQLRELAEQLRTELAMLCKERPAGTA